MGRTGSKSVICRNKPLSIDLREDVRLQAPGQYLATEPVRDRDEIRNAPPHRVTFDIGASGCIETGDCHWQHIAAPDHGLANDGYLRIGPSERSDPFAVSDRPPYQAAHHRI